MQIGGAIDAVRLYPTSEAKADEAGSRVLRRDRSDVSATPATDPTGDVGPRAVGDVEPSLAAAAEPTPLDRRGERAVRKRLKQAVHAVRDELKELARRPVDADTGAGTGTGRVDTDLLHDLKRIERDFRHSIQSVYRRVPVEATTDPEGLLAATRSAFETLLDRVDGAVSPEAPEAPESPGIDPGAAWTFSFTFELALSFYAESVVSVVPAASGGELDSVG